MTFLSQLADRTILQATTHPIDPEGRERVLVKTPTGNIEIWCLRTEAQSTESTAAISKIVLIKFPGTGGRAERSGPFPANLWDRLSTEIWTVNHRGWGQSDGPATLQNFSETCDAVWQHAKQTFPDRKVVLNGNSLGCMSALYLSARYDAAGIYLRNPPPLANLIATMPKYAWPTLGLSRLVANQVPKELDSIANATNSKCPALFVTSEKDRVVPARYQNKIEDSYSGPTKQFIILGADHHHSIPESQETGYLSACRWLEDQIINSDYSLL